MEMIYTDPNDYRSQLKIILGNDGSMMISIYDHDEIEHSMEIPITKLEFMIKTLKDDLSISDIPTK